MGGLKGPYSYPEHRGRFDVFLTIDKGFEFEHPIKQFSSNGNPRWSARSAKLRSTSGFRFNVTTIGPPLLQNRHTLTAILF